MKSLLFACTLATTLGQHTAQAATDYLAELQPYQARQSVSGVIRTWGNPYIPELLKAWQDGFIRHHPGIRFDTNMRGTEAAMAGLYADIADIVFIGREAYQPEIDAFTDWFGYRPTGFKITSGSFATQHKTFALMVYVHKDNPVDTISLDQLDALYGVERRRGASAPLQSWGQLGVTGPLADHPINPYGYSFDTGMAGFFRLTVLQDSHRWNPALKDFNNGRTATGEVINAGTYILEALAKDPDGIGFSNVLFENPGVKRLAVTEHTGEPPVVASEDNAWRRSYPLTRYSTVFINRHPGQPAQPRVAEFIRYILSRDGMAAVVQDRAFLPLNARAIAAELKGLE